MKKISEAKIKNKETNKLYKGQIYYHFSFGKERGDKVFGIIIKLTFLAASALGVGSFFGTISDSYIIAAISAIIGSIIIIGTAFIYNKKKGKALMNL